MIYKVRKFVDLNTFEDGINAEAVDEYTLHSWQDCGQDAWYIVAVFVKEKP